MWGTLKNEEASIKSGVSLFERGEYFWRENWSNDVVPYAIECYLQASSMGNIDAKLKLGNIYMFQLRGVARNVNKALLYLEEVSNAGSVDAMHLLGVSYWAGINGVVSNMSKGRELFERASDADGEKCFRFAMEYLKPPHIQMSIAILEMLRQRRNSDAMLTLGDIYADNKTLESINFKGNPPL